MRRCILYSYKNEYQTIKYDNPFISCRIHEKSFYNLIKYFDKINFYNFNIQESTVIGIGPGVNSIRLLDYDILIYFIHYDIFKMVNNWLKRVPRLIEKLKDPNWKENTLFIYNSYYKSFKHDKNKNPEQFSECIEYRNKILTEFEDRNILIDNIKQEEKYSTNKIIFPFDYKHYDEVGAYISKQYPQYLK